eukprot:gene18513-24230_t
MNSIYLHINKESTCLPNHQHCGWPSIPQTEPIARHDLPLFVLSVGLEGAGHHLWTEILDTPVFDCVWINGRHYHRDISDGVPRTAVSKQLEGFKEQMKLRLDSGNPKCKRIYDAEDSFPTGAIRKSGRVFMRPDIINLQLLDGIVYNIKYLLILRNTTDTALSALRRNFFSHVDSELRTVEHTLTYLESALRGVPCNRIFIAHYEHVLAEPSAYKEPLANFLELSSKEKEVLFSRLSKNGKIPPRKVHKLTQYKECQQQNLNEEQCYGKITNIIEKFIKDRDFMWPTFAASAIPTATIANISSLRDPNNSAYSLTSLESDLSGSYDSTIGLSSREVKLWSSILLFLSAFTLFNNLSYLTSTGQFGTSIFDSIVNLLDTFCSAGGLYVGNLGMNAARNIELDSIKKYVQSLTILAVLSLLMRYAWVVDVILEVQSTVRKSQEKSNTNTDVDNTTTGSTSTDDSNVPLSGKLVVTFGIQAVIFALVCTAAWLNCVHRAYRFRNAVQTLNGVLYPRVNNDLTLTTLKQHLFEHIVHLPSLSNNKPNNNLYTQIKGIPQGSILSPILCNLYYGKAEAEIFGTNKQIETIGLKDKTLILRLMDDYIVISLDKSCVTNFLQRAYTCLKSVNYCVEVEFNGNRVKLPQVFSKSANTAIEMKWCGFTINSDTLETIRATTLNLIHNVD